MRPGLATDQEVVTTRTQPLDSCITIARTKRGSTLLAAATERMEDFRVAISEAESLGTAQLFSHDSCMMGVLREKLWDQMLVGMSS